MDLRLRLSRTGRGAVHDEGIESFHLTQAGDGRTTPLVLGG
jgi:hypothetical protein